MKILLTNCWQAGNTGDVAIWKNLMKHLAKNLTNVSTDIEFLIVSQTLLDWDVNQLAGFKTKFFINNIGETEPLFNAVREADVVISQGGGYMAGDGMYPYLQAFELAQSLNKPTFFSTQTFAGPINDETKTLLKKVLNNALVVSPRDKGTYNLLKDAGVDKNKLEILPDTVFDIGIEDYDFPYPNSVKFCIRGFMTNTDVLKEKAKLADMITETIGQVVFIPIGHGGDRDDRTTAEEIVSYMKHEAVIIKDELTAEQLKSTMKDGIVISSRYHGLIYAASMETPFVPLTPDIDNKTPGLLELFDYPIGVIDKGSLNAEKAFTTVLEVWKNKEKYHELIKAKLPEVKRISALVYDKIIKEIKYATIQ